LAEPIAFPAQLRVVTVWFPGSLRATANSVSVAGSSIGSIIAPPLVAWLAIHWNWHVAFLVPGCVGFLLVGLWWGVYRDPVGEIEALNHRSIGALKLGRVFGWGELWGRRSLWGLILCRFVSDPVWYFCLFWFPGYLQEHSGLSLAQVGKVGWIPFLAADLGGIATAMWSDRMVVRRGMEPLRARKVMLCVVAMAGPVCALVPGCSRGWEVIGIFSLVGVVCLSWLFSLSVVIAEAFPAGNVGSVLGIAGGFGAAGAIVFNNYVGRMMQSFGSGRIFLVMALLHPVAAVILWTMTRRENPVGETR
jgi:ACS family hexuronate transporter-like MFS transporter